MARRPRFRLEELWPEVAPAGAEEAGEAPAERTILRCAIELFGRHGYSATSTRTIASAASVTAPLIGYHFGSKEGLFQECVDVVVGGVTSRILAGIENDDRPLEEVVRWFAQLHVDAAHRYRHSLRFILSIAYGPEEGQPAFDPGKYWLPVMAWFAARIQRAIDEGEFEPRAGTTVPMIVSHLFNIVHFEVFGIYERERFGGAFCDDSTFFTTSIDPVGEVVAQFFHGAGRLAAPLRHPASGGGAPSASTAGSKTNREGH